MHPFTKVARIHAGRIFSLFAFIIMSALASPAFAALSASASTNFPSTFTLNQEFDASITIRNTSTDLEALDTILLTDIELFPSCSSVNGAVCNPDTNAVFSITNIVPGPGEFDPPVNPPGANEPNYCDAINSGGFDVVAIPGGIKINALNPVNIGVVGHSNLCLINFHVTVLATPGHDADPGTSGIQTKQLVCVHIEGYDLGGTADIPGPGPCTTGRPLFVIGDVEPHSLGKIVNFWGSQWWKNNDMSGFVNAGYPAFKGYATDADNFCGGMWETRPGNSSDPPDVIPDDVMIIVTSTVHKDGPDITGDIREILLVHSDGGYGPAPGHRGNGPVTQVLCRLQQP